MPLRAFGLGLSVTLGEPLLWLVGAAGFLARGGILLLLVPIVTLPSPVGISTFIGADALTPFGLSDRFIGSLLTVVVAVAAIAVVLFTVMAWVDRWLIGRVVDDADTAAQRTERGPVLRPQARAAVEWRIVAVQVLALAPLAVALVVAGSQVAEAVRVELLLPSGFESSLVQRVLARAWVWLTILAVGLAVTELLGSVATRHVVAGRGVADALAATVGDLVRHPLRHLGAWLLGWVSTLVIIGPSAWALVVAARLVRAAYLDPAAPFAGEALVRTALATTVLVAVFCSAVVLAGFAGALRGSLWTLTWLGPLAHGEQRRQARTIGWVPHLWTRRRH
jgi:hypothetical protein